MENFIIAESAAAKIVNSSSAFIDELSLACGIIIQFVESVIAQFKDF